ncbi:MAG: DMT family transporter [Anaerovoracaceae bacterium]
MGAEEISREKSKRFDFNKNRKGILYIISAAFFFCMMTVFVKLAGDLPTLEKSFFRNLLAVVIAAVTLVRSGAGFRIKKESAPWLFVRCLSGTLGMVANFYAISMLDLPDSNMLNKMSPVFAVIMSAILFREKPDRFETITIIIAFIGVVFVIQPTAGAASFPALIGLMSGFGAGLAYAAVHKLGMLGEKGPVIVFYFSLFTCLFCLPGMIIGWQDMSLKQFLFLMGAGAGGAGGQFSITAAYQSAPAKEISVFDYTQVLFAAVFGFLIFDEIPNVLSVVGYVIIIGVAVLRWHHARLQDD